MKRTKKILAVCLSLALMLGLLGASVPTAAEDNTVWGEFEPQLMTSYTSYGGAFGEWSAADVTGVAHGYLLVGSQIMRAHTNGYSAIRRFDCDMTGTLYFERNSTQKMIYLTGGSAGDSVKFGIFNEKKELIWPTNGDWYTVAYGEDYDGYIEIPVTAGGSLYFVATDPTSNQMSLNLHGILHIGSAPCEEIGYYGRQIHSSGYFCGSPMDTQGGAGTHDVGRWYYMYAPSVELTTADPNGVTDLGNDEYTVDYGETLTPMTKISTANGDANTGWLGNGKYNNTIFVSGMGAYFGNLNHSLVVRYTAGGNGGFRIGYAGIQLKSSWPAGAGVDFCIVDKTGKVVYPENGGLIEVRAGTDNPFDNAAAAAFYYSNLQKGDHLDFVFIPRGENLAANYAKWVYLAGSFNHAGSVSGDRIDSSGRLFLGNDESQGSRHIEMFTTADLSVNKVITGEWSEFVQLKNGLTAAPATTEVQVNIPTNVPDWKVGTVISDMNGVDGTGYAVMMDTFGRPRFVSGNVDWTADVDVRTGEWTRLTFTADTANRKLSLYVDGVLADETTLADDAALAVSGKAPVIGNDLSYASTTAFQGAMKKLALSASISDGAAELAIAGSEHYYKLNGDNRDKAGDNDGTKTAVNQDWYEAGKPADADTANGEYTIVHIGDNQVVTDFIDDGYQEVTQWIADNAERLNIQMVINSGDLVNYAATASQWVDAKAGMDILKEAQIPYVYALGNHEYPMSGTKTRTTAEFNDYFAIEDHLAQAVGQVNETKLVYAYPRTAKISGVEDLMPNTTEGNTSGVVSYGNTYVETMENAVYMVTMGGKQYAIFALECQPRFVVTEWAHTIMQALEAEYPDLITIVIEHDYLSSSGGLVTYNSCFDAAERAISHTPASLYSDFISQYKSIQMVLCGHVATGIASRTDIGVNGNKIVTIMNDQSYEGNGGEGNILLLRCKADGTVIKAEYYSPILEKHYVPQYQFEFDTAADSDVVLDLPAFTAMGTANGSDRWHITGSPYGTCVGGLLIGVNNKNHLAVRTFVPTISGTATYTITTSGYGDAYGKAALCVCKADGTVIWPAEGQWETELAKSSTYKTSTFDVVAGEPIHLIMKPLATPSALIYIPAKSTISITDAESTTTSYTSNSASTGVSYETQGNNGWYANYYTASSSINLVPAPYTVTYGVDGEGGKISAASSGTSDGSKCVVSADGTVRFTASPDVGYRIVGYYVNGVYHKHTRRILTLPMIKKDLDVKVKFERIKLEGDTNGDGVVNIIDMVNMNNGVADESAFADKSVCDLVDAVAAADGVDVVDVDDVKELRKRILE